MANEQPKDESALSVDTHLARLMVEHKLATQEEVNQCLSIKAAQSEDQSNLSLADILVSEEIVTQRQIQRAKKTIQEIRATSAQQIPGYQIIEVVGSGAMATVYKARQMSLDRIVAIKVLPKRFSESPEYVERFYKEGKAAARLNHANIVQAFDVGEASGYHYFVMEYVEGHTLFDEMAGGKVFQEEEALQVILQIARALKHAHSQGLIHRDVKPKNIMMASDGIAKLADMGLARVATDEEAARAEVGRAFGTPYYISPEQIRGELDIDFRSDIYSLGATLYHMITGRVPFQADTPAAVMHKHLKEPLAPPDHINTALSAGIGEVVEVMMAKDRRRRYATTTDLLMDLDAIAKGQPPLQARRQVDANLLTGLVEGVVDTDEPRQQPAFRSSRQPAQAGSAETYTIYIVLAVALGVSVLLNIVLILLMGR